MDVPRASLQETIISRSTSSQVYTCERDETSACNRLHARSCSPIRHSERATATSLQTHAYPVIPSLCEPSWTMHLALAVQKRRIPSLAGSTPIFGRDESE